MTRVLIVDDKEENLYYLQALLSGNGCTVDSARHGAEALVMARQAPPDVIISDLLMPVMDGYTLLRHWKVDGRLKRIPFIVYTATYTEAEDERLALNLGADAFILKPAEPEDFLARLRQVQANVASAVPVPPKTMTGDENDLLKVYSETLIRKLEEKTIQLEDANRALQKDIAERTAVEAALRKSEAEFRLLAETMPQIVWMTRPDGWHFHFNKRWTDYTGLTMEQGLGHGWITAVHPDDQPLASKGWKRAIANGVTYEIEYRLRRADGTYHWMLDRALPLRDANGEIQKWFGTCTDIDELKQAQTRIGEQAALLDQARDAILVRDLEHRVVYWNQGAERLFGWTAGEAAGRPVAEFMQPDSATFTKAVEAVLRHEAWEGEIQESTKAGAKLTMESRWTLLRDGQGKPKSILAIGTDITERKKLELQFLRAQRMESIGTLAGGIAHDLNNVLAPITMSLEMLKELARNEDDQVFLTTLEASARRGSDLVQQVLSFARGVEGKRIPVNPRHIIRDLVKVMKDTLPKSITVGLKAPNELWTVTGDPTQLHQVFLNLCVNARDAMPNGGKLTVSMQNVMVDDTYAGMNPDARPGPHVMVEVSDNGSGIPPEIRERIFEPFFTTKEIGKGTGLGLSTTMGIVKSHGGFINLYSEVGKGTSFRIYLPANPTAVAGEETAGDEAGLKHGQGELVLVVDDEESIRQVATRTLERFGYRVMTAGNGVEAVASYVQRRVEIDVVLTDMAMPVMDGPALVKALHAINPKVRIIASSGLAPTGPMTKGPAGEVLEFVPKPYTAETLLKALAVVLRPG